MFWISLCFCFFITTNLTRSNMISNKGWKPLTYEEVFRGFLKPKQTLQSFWPYNANVDVIKLVKPQIFTEFTINNDATYPEETIQAIQPTTGLPDAVNNFGTKDTFNQLQNSQIINTKNDLKDVEIFNSEINITPNRMAKQLLDKKSRNNNINRMFFEDNVDLNSKDSNYDIEIKEPELQQDASDLYKVTEEENIDEAKKTSKGYIYEKPPIKNHFESLNQNNIQTSSHNNITDTFYKILSKYNIKVNDESENYKISRKPRPQIDDTRHFLYLPLPIETDKNRIYELNRLLAVFLSKYGYYLPGFYGVSNKYKNLYGYLAANNIHNNKPFGLYKVFADTDSAN